MKCGLSIQTRSHETDGAPTMANTSPRKPATLKHIAERTGYSINTVSRALRDKPDIAPETRALIRAVADELGYQSNRLASSLRLGYTRTIAVILPDVSNPHFAILMKEIEDHARTFGYSSFLTNTDEDEALEKNAIRDALNQSVDGIILCPAQHSDENTRQLAQSGVPFVLIGRRDEQVPDYVVCDDELGAHQATAHLIDRGHRDILMLHGPEHISSARERRDGYLRALADAGLADRALMREVSVTGEGAGQAVAETLEAGVPFSAIFAFSDLLAWQAWCELSRRGIHVPEDVSLVGFDHIQSRLHIPFPLTTVSSYKGRMSTKAVELLVDRMLDRMERPDRHVVIRTNLLEGETVRQRT